MGLSDSLASTNKSSGKVNSKAFSNGKGGKGKLGGMMDSTAGINHNVAGTVVGVGNIVAKAAGALGFKDLQEKLTGSIKISYEKKANEPSRFANDSGLRGFYTQFGGQSQKNIERIDPLNTFTCEFKFYPNVFTRTQYIGKSDRWDETRGKQVTLFTNISNSSKPSVFSKGHESVISHLLEDYNISTIKNDYNTNTIEGKTHEGVVREQDKPQSNVERYRASQTITKTEYTNNYILNFDIYIQKVSLPQIEVQGGEEITTLVGKFPVPGNIVVPSANSFSMDIINTNLPILENVFYPWMRETTLPKWSYDTQPFTTADITIDFTEHANFKYHFFGCRPTQIFLLQPEQQPLTNPVRQVHFVFDFMTIETDKKKIMTGSTPDSGVRGSFSGANQNGDSNTNLANSILFSAANTLRL